jgi:hypothetical protein
MQGKKSKDAYECLAESLTEETLQEAADTFFGQRKGIEEELQIYSQWVQELSKIQSQVHTVQANLHFILGQDKEQTVPSFYRHIGVDPEQVPWPQNEDGTDLGWLQVPFALRAKAQYAKLLCSAYAQFASQAADFMYGRTYKDPQDSRCQRMTLSYNQVYDFYTQLKQKIAKANQDNAPSQVLQYVKQLDIQRSAKESLVAVPLQYSLDQEMAMAAPDFAQSGLTAYPDFPPLQDVQRAVKDFAYWIFTKMPKHMRHILALVNSTQ